MKILKSKRNGYTVSLEIEAQAEKLQGAMDLAFKKLSKRAKVPGFRQGKLTRGVFEKYYGKESLLQEAIMTVVNDAYMAAIDEMKLEVVDYPRNIDIKEYKEEYGTPDLARELFNEMKIQLNHPEAEDFYRAVAFYIINKCSFSGLTESSSFSPQASVSNFSMNGIDKLLEYSKLIQNWKITTGPYWDMMMTSAPVGTFWFFDPPYDIKDNLYGRKGELHKGFNHEEFCAWITQGNVKDKWMITYNTNPTLVEWYDGYNQTKWDLTYTMRSVGDYMNEQKDRAELLITNYDETISDGILEFNKSKQEVGSY